MPSEGEPTWVYIPSNNVRRPRHGSRRGSAWAERRRNRIHRTHERRWRVDDLSSEPRGCATRKGTRGTDRERAGDELQEGASPVHKRPLRKKRPFTNGRCARSVPRPCGSSIHVPSSPSSARWGIELAKVRSLQIGLLRSARGTLVRTSSDHSACDTAQSQRSCKSLNSNESRASAQALRRRADPASSA